jgi:hypothetical protein
MGLCLAAGKLQELQAMIGSLPVDEMEMRIEG